MHQVIQTQTLTLFVPISLLNPVTGREVGGSLCSHFGSFSSTWLTLLGKRGTVATTFGSFASCLVARESKLLLCTWASGFALLPWQHYPCHAR
jgi:hypothetical protein